MVVLGVVKIAKVLVLPAHSLDTKARLPTQHVFGHAALVSNAA